MTAVTVPAHHRPELGAGVRISEPLLHGPDLVHLIKDTDSGQAYKVGTKEHFLISRMDGTRSIEEIGAEYAAHFGRRLADANWQPLLASLGARGLLKGAPAPTVPAQPQPQPQPPPPHPPVRGLLRGTIRLVADADATTAALHRVVRPLLSPWALAPLLALTAVMEVLLLQRLPELIDATAGLFTEPALLTAVATLLWLSTALHELAHGVVARHHGGHVAEIGLRWRLPVVMMYCTVDDFLHLPGRRARLATAGAGAVMNLLFLLPFFAVWSLAPLDAATDGALGALLLLGSVQAFTMLVPLPPLDGYKMASQLLGATGLAASTATFLRLTVRRDPAAAGYPSRARRAYAAYALLAVLTLSALAAALALLVHRLLTAAP
ncbi:M50 family metallopeptidase [Streptomyces sp. NPDC059881]|uniref:M50 family metallopeptidase n=1 Tax=Streptomyces sp. NPDC059881 TaxID=3346986 RepID=UPI003653E8A4